MKTGWPPGLLQDDCRTLSKWFASRPDARYQLRKIFVTDKPEALRLADEAARGTRVSEGQCLPPHAFKQTGGRLGPSLAKAMDTKQATRAGVQAYRDGIGCVPALNQRFLEAACDTGRTLEMLEAYIHGWTIARLADGVTDLATPSVMELKKIEADD